MSGTNSNLNSETPAASNQTVSSDESGKSKFIAKSTHLPSVQAMPSAEPVATSAIEDISNSLKTIQLQMSRFENQFKVLNHNPEHQAVLNALRKVSEAVKSNLIDYIHKHLKAKRALNLFLSKELNICSKYP
ncbi:MAG: hypothetical protein HC880_06600 [Bacteroidia bacterium]|nr:hypothetical protein [Bacteroidia bacterium]